MEEDSTVSAVQCSVIQYCSEPTLPSSQSQQGISETCVTDPVVDDSSDSTRNGSHETGSETDNVNGGVEENSPIVENNCSEKEIKVEVTNTKDEADDKPDNCLNNQTVTEAIKEESDADIVGSKDGTANVVGVKEELQDGGETVYEQNEEIENAVSQGQETKERGRKRELSGGEEPSAKRKNNVVNGRTSAQPEEFDSELESDEEIVKPKKRGRNKKNPEPVPAHLSLDMGLGYRILSKFLDTPLFSVFVRPNTNHQSDSNVSNICLNQIKKKFEDNKYTRISEFVADVRTMLSNAYMQRDTMTVKKALRLEQVLDQRIAQLPNYLRPECALVLTEDELSNKKIRISKGGGFISLLQERADKLRQEEDREKRKVAAEGRKQQKEELDKDILEWESNVLLRDSEEDIKCTLQLVDIGQFIHICADLLNIGAISQFEVERMLIFPQYCDTLDLFVTSLLSNSIERARLSEFPAMPYTIWHPKVRTKVNSWYKCYHREFRNAQKPFEEHGVEPEFFQICGPDYSPLDYFYFHELPFVQRAAIIKALCDSDFVKKSTVCDKIRNMPHEELEGKLLGFDRNGFRYIHFPQFDQFAIRIYKMAPMLPADIEPDDVIDCYDENEERSGVVTPDKVFRDIWDVGVPEIRPKKKVKVKKKGIHMKVKIEPTPPKSLRQSARAKRKVIIESSESDSSDTDLATLKTKLNKPEKTFISLNVFRLPREKVKPTNVKKSYYHRKLEREAERQRLEGLEASKDKMADDDEQSESMEPRDDRDDDDDDTQENFSVKNLDNLKMVLSKDMDEGENTTDDKKVQDGENATDEKKVQDGENGSDEKKVQYTTPSHLLPDRKKFCCVVDSINSLRQLIVQLSPDDDVEIINKSSLRSGKTKLADPTAPCEVKLTERLQQLLDDLEDWDNEFYKSNRTILEKMYNEYNTFTNAVKFVHPNLGYYETNEVPVNEAAPPAADPEPQPPQVNPVSEDVLPPSPLGSLRPRTRTRTSQPAKMPELEVDAEEEEYLESSGESDDNWEMPRSRSRRRRPVPLEPKVINNGSRPKRTTKRNSRYSNAAPDSPEKPQRATFCSSSDPSEELNWEKMKLKLLENSPKKYKAANAVSNEPTDGAMLPLPRTRRLLPPPIPGNKKPYFNHSHLTSVNKTDDEVQILNSNDASKSRRVQPKLPRPVTKRTATAGTQACDVIDLEPTKPTTIEQFFVTDGTKFVKIDEATVQELIKNQDAVRRFSSELDLNQKIQIVKKRSVNAISPSPNPIGNKMAKLMRPTVPETQRPGLRLIRPQNVPNQASAATAIGLQQDHAISDLIVYLTQNQQKVHLYQLASKLLNSNRMCISVQNTLKVDLLIRNIHIIVGLLEKVINSIKYGSEVIRPTQRVAAPQNMMYLQATTPQNMVQIPQGVSPGLVQVLTRPSTPADADKVVQVMTRGGQGGSELVQVVTRATPAPGETVRPQEMIGIVSPPSSQTPVGYYQVQTGGKQQPLQFVQVSQGASVAQGGAVGQNMIRLAMTTSSQVVQSGASFMRLASTGQLVQLAQTPQSSSSTPSVVQAPPGAVGLVQVQGIPGEQITYLPLSAGIKGNLVQIQPQLKGVPSQMGTLVQMASPTGAPRLVQMQTPSRLQGVQQHQQATPHAQVVQFQRPSTAQTPPRPSQVVTPATPTPPRPQTAVVQVYATPRMAQVSTPSTPPRPQPVQQVRQPISPQNPLIRSPAPTLASQPRPVRMVPAQQGTQGTVMVSTHGGTPRLASVVQGSIQPRPGQQLVRMQAPVRANGPVVRPHSILAQTLTTGGRPNQLVAQVELPGKPGIYQLQNADGQTVSYVQIVSSTASNVAGSNLMQLPAGAAGANLIQVQSPAVRQQLVQVQGAPTAAARPQLQSRPQMVSPRPQIINASSGNIMVSGGPNRPQIAPGMVISGARQQMVQVQVTGTSSIGNYIISNARPQLQTAVSSQAMVQTVAGAPRAMVVQSSQTNTAGLQRLQPPALARPQMVQTARSSPSTATSVTASGTRPQLVHVQVSRNSPTKASQVYTIQDGTQPMLLRASNLVSSGHPVISIDDDDEINVVTSQCGETVIDGVTYQITTSSDQLLFNSRYDNSRHISN